MTKTEIIQALRGDYEYIEGGRAKGISYALELLKQTPTHFAKVPYAITLLQLYLINDNWTANSVLHIIVNGVEMEEVEAIVAMTKYGKARIRSFAENNVYLFT